MLDAPGDRFTKIVVGRFGICEVCELVHEGHVFCQNCAHKTVQLYKAEPHDAYEAAWRLGRFKAVIVLHQSLLPRPFWIPGFQ